MLFPQVTNLSPSALLAGADFDTCAEYLEECINRKEPLVKVLRLLTLLNLTNSGIKPKQLEFFKVKNTSDC